MLPLGFEELKSESCAYTKIEPTTQSLVLEMVYIDDILIASSCKESIISEKKESIKAKWNIKDMEGILKV
jgi:hypothetical protein